MGAIIAPASGATANVSASGAITSANGASVGPEINVVEKAACGVLDGGDITPIGGAVGLVAGIVPVNGATARTMHGVVGEVSGSGPMHDISDKAAEVDPLVAAWAFLV
ncbi:hypothetical protein OIU78_029189 [Salix suchowensis]|nr:hypothetical protein OIU78_029189 [Salix suchowensis]